MITNHADWTILRSNNKVISPPAQEHSPHLLSCRGGRIRIQPRCTTLQRSPITYSTVGPNLLPKFSPSSQLNTKFRQTASRRVCSLVMQRRLGWYNRASKRMRFFKGPFSPPNCPQLWTVEFLERVAKCLSSSGRLATYSCAAAVRTALITIGLKIGSTPPVGRRSPGTVASWSSTDLPMLSQQEQEHLLTRAAIPYRDPQLSDSTEVILHRRQQEQYTSSLEPTSHWRKRLNSW